MTLRGYSLGSNVNTHFCKYPMPEFSHESSHRIPCVHTCFVNSNEIYCFSYPQLPAKLTFKNSVLQGEIRANIYTVTSDTQGVNKAPFFAGTQAIVLGH